MEKYSKQYRKVLIDTVLADYEDQYKQCKDCKKPTHKMYVCSHCGSDDP